MKTFKKSSMAIITTLVLGLLPALPAAAQTAPETTAARKYSVQVSQAESGGQDSPMKFTVTQKTGTDNEEVIITLVKDPKAKAEPEKAMRISPRQNTMSRPLRVRQSMSGRHLIISDDTYGGAGCENSGYRG